MLSPEGKECLLAIHSAGDIFGELCLSGLGSRLETAIAMEETNLKQIPCSSFFARLRSDLLFEGFAQYLAARIGDQQQVIANLAPADSEQRLGKTLLQLARTLGKQDPRSIRIEHKISHEELSEMVGATRPRVSMFMQRFRKLGLIETSAERFLIIKEKKLTDYLAHVIKSKLKLVRSIGALDSESEVMGETKLAAEEQVAQTLKARKAAMLVSAPLASQLN
jgi:CRP/FNR family transcriptional regulator, cyclic AMP receptor protein